MLKKEYDYLFKMVLIGDTHVGKSCLLIRFADDCFQENYICTIGVDFRFRTLQINNSTIKLQIWDTAGQAKHRGLREGYYIGAKKVVVVFDVTDRQSLDNVPYWLGLVKHVCDNVPILLVANKADDPDPELKIAEIEVLASNYGLEWVFASAKTGLNLDKLF